MASYSESELDFQAIGRFTNLKHSFNTYWHLDRPMLGSRMFTALTKEERTKLKSMIAQARAKNKARRVQIFPNSAESFSTMKITYQNRIRERLIQIGAPYRVFLHSFDRRLYKIRDKGVDIFYFPMGKMNEIHVANVHARESIRLDYDCRARSISLSNTFTSVTMTKGEFWTSLSVAEGPEVSMEFLPYLKQDVELAQRQYEELTRFQKKIRGFLEAMKAAKKK